MVNSHFTFKWEGAVDKKLNFRDLGKSINECLKRKELPEDRFFRASGFFSGWSCDKVGNPDLMISLNYNTQDDSEYYCRKENGFLSGLHFQKAEISDLEFMETWTSNPEFVQASCKSVDQILNQNLSSRILIHCDAGRDRTGAISAIVAALVWESANNKPVTDEMIDSIECDYRKSASLSTSKYGRIETFLKESRKEFGDMRGFYRHFCQH